VKQAEAPPVRLPTGPGLTIGISEQNPGLFWSAKAKPDPGAFGPWRDRLVALRPALYRLSVDWAALQPSQTEPPNFEQRSDGCMRGIKPCRPYDGIREILQAIHSEQQDGGGFEVIVAIYGVPDWAAATAAGCRQPAASTSSRPITAAGLRGYRALIRSLLALGRQEGVALRWWAPWNEPNSYLFVSPQRQACSPHSTALSPAIYARLARAMREELAADRASPAPKLVIGELADISRPSARGASVPEFWRALPDDVVCSAAVYSQHEYARSSGPQEAKGAVGQLEDALDARPCAHGKPIWVTETGVGGAHVGDRRAGGPTTQRADCRAMAVSLARWHRDPRVTAAFQYTFRDDPVFPVGLTDVSLTRAWPAYDLWLAWGGERAPDGPAPALPAACHTGALSNDRQSSRQAAER
jgi:hypothetical protein